MESTMCVPTDRGKKLLGAMIKSARTERGHSQDQVIAVIQASTGRKIGKATLSDIETGKRIPEWETMAAISAYGIGKNPKTGQWFNTADLFWIACERLIPDSGEFLGADCLPVLDGPQSV